MKCKLIACEVLFREACAAVARSPHQVDIEFLPKGLHDIGGAQMCARVQEVVDRDDALGYQFILLGYALCGGGTAGLEARQTPLVIPRAHDCITLLLGSRDRYRDYFTSHDGVYFGSTGWLERGQGIDQRVLAQTRERTGAGWTLDELIAKYGEDNGRYLYDEFNSYEKAYQRLTFIRTGLEPDSRFEDQARANARSHGWEFEIVEGDLRLVQALAEGRWDDPAIAADFAILRPGERLAPSYQDDIFRILPPEA
jgi:hypothetical protein